MNVFIVSEIDRDSFDINKVFQEEKDAIFFAREMFREVLNNNMIGMVEEKKEKLKKCTREMLVSISERYENPLCDEIFYLTNHKIDYGVSVHVANVF